MLPCKEWGLLWLRLIDLTETHRKQHTFHCIWNWETPETIHLLVWSCKTVHLDVARVRWYWARYSIWSARSTFLFKYRFFFTTYNSFLVGEDEEVSIKEVTDAIVKAVGFQGEYTVRISPCLLYFTITSRLISNNDQYSSTLHVRMVNSANLLRTKNFYLWLMDSNSRLSQKVCFTRLLLTLIFVF